MPLLYHITQRAEIEAARAGDEYRPRAFDQEGFIHCSYRHQVLGVADRLYRGQSGLVLLEIEPTALDAEVIDENLEGGSELFPHIYGPLPLRAIAAIHAFPSEGDGTFRLPAALVRDA